MQMTAANLVCTSAKPALMLPDPHHHVASMPLHTSVKEHSAVVIWQGWNEACISTCNQSEVPVGSFEWTFRPVTESPCHI